MCEVEFWEVFNLIKEQAEPKLPALLATLLTLFVIIVCFAVVECLNIYDAPDF